MDSMTILFKPTNEITFPKAFIDTGKLQSCSWSWFPNIFSKKNIQKTILTYVVIMTQPASPRWYQLEDEQLRLVAQHF